MKEGKERKKEKHQHSWQMKWWKQMLLPRVSLQCEGREGPVGLANSPDKQWQDKPTENSFPEKGRRAMGSVRDPSCLNQSVNWPFEVLGVVTLTSDLVFWWRKA